MEKQKVKDFVCMFTTNVVEGRQPFGTAHRLRTVIAFLFLISRQIFTLLSFLLFIQENDFVFNKTHCRSRILITLQ